MSKDIALPVEQRQWFLSNLKKDEERIAVLSNYPLLFTILSIHTWKTFPSLMNGKKVENAYKTIKIKRLTHNLKIKKKDP